MNKKSKEMLKSLIKEIINELYTDPTSDSMNRPRIRVKMKNSVLGAGLFGGRDFPVYVENNGWFFPSPGIAIDKNSVEIIGPYTKLPDNFS